MHPNLFRMNCEIGRGSDEEYSGCLCCYQKPLANCAVPEGPSLWGWIPAGAGSAWPHSGPDEGCPCAAATMPPQWGETSAALE